MKQDISHYWKMTAVLGMNHLGCYLTGASHLFVLVHMKWRGSQGSDLSLSEEETSARASFPSDTGAAGGDHSSEAGGEIGSLFPKFEHTKQFSSLIYFTPFYLFKSRPTELREGRAGHRCDRAAGTLNGLKDALEFEDFP